MPEVEPSATSAGVPGRLLVAALALGTVAAQLVFRAADDNRLTSFAWVFAGVHPGRVYALVAAGILLAQLAASVPLPPRRPVAILFLVSYAVGACFWGEPDAIVDASRYFTQAKHLEVHGLGHFLAEWGRSIPAWTDLPLVPLLYGLVFRAFGESRVAVEAFTTLLFSGSVALTFLVGKRLWDEDVGLTAGAFLLAIPYLLTQVPGMLVDVPTMFFLALAVFAAVEAFQRGGAGRILLASAAVFLAFFSKYSAWLLLTVLPVIGIVVGRGGARRTLLTGSAIALASATLVAAAPLPSRDVYAEQIALLLGYQAPGLRRWGESFLSTFLFQVHPFLTAAAALSAWTALRRRDPRWLVAAWPVLLLLALQVHRIRYWIPAFPMLALMGALGLRAIRASETRRLVLGCAVASSLAVALGGFLPFLRSTSAANLKTAGEYLDTLEETRVEVFTAFAPDSEINPAVWVPILDLFTSKVVIHRPDPTARPPAARMDTSPLRFTWAHRNPAFYEAGGPSEGAAVAVISDDAARPLPEPLAARVAGHPLARTFTADEGVFEQKTEVAVYRAACAPVANR